MSEVFRRIAVVGAGAFGTALALAAERARLADAGSNVILWGRDPHQVSAIDAGRENERHLPGVSIPASITVTADIAVFAKADLILLAIPSQATRAALSSLAPQIRREAVILACAKGVEAATSLFQTDIVAELLPDVRPAALSGPGFADDIARRLPTAMTIAARDVPLAGAICAALASETFRPYASDDLAGVQLGGAAKNVLAIACGIVVGLGLGESARAALIARGLAEMTRLGVALGARAETFAGLSGLGDLVLTATSGKSRNARFGAALARSRPVGELLAAGAPLAEGAHSAATIAALARRHAVETPIIDAVAAVIAGSVTVRDAMHGLVSRPLKRETD